MISEEFDAGGYGIGVAVMARGKTGMVNDIKFIESALFTDSSIPRRNTQVRTSHTEIG